MLVFRTHRPCNAVQIAESRRLGGVTIPVRRVAEGGVKGNMMCEPTERASV